MTNQEKKDLNDFFYHLLLKNSGIYVLHGSKPMVEMAISKKSPEENRKIYAQTHENRNPTYKEIILHYFFRDDIPFYIQQWEKVKDHIKMNNYLVVIHSNNDNPDLPSLYFINVSNTIKLLQKHYSFFKEILGFDFDPLEIIYSTENSSIFLDKITKDYVAYGLLFGFGEENARFFDYWSNGIDNRKGKALDYFKFAPFRFSDDQGSIFYFSYTYQHFPLPTFRHFENDPVLETYKKEREQIKKLYMFKDPLIVNLQKLTEKRKSLASPFSKKESLWLHFLKKMKLI